MITVMEDGYMLNINLEGKGYTVGGAAVTGVSMFVNKDPEAGDGDLAVTWDIGGLENTGGGDMGMLLMRGDDDEVGGVMGEFYWNNGFTDTLQTILKQEGFGEEAVEAVATSEWGMQDEGRASYDAYELAEEIRAKGDMMEIMAAC